MNIEIRKLSKDQIEAYLHFFDVTPHDSYESDEKCYCVGWCSEDHRIKTDFSSSEKRRILAKQYIENGTLQGYLAYSDKEIVGWCNANDKKACINSGGWMYVNKNVDISDQNIRTKSIFCYVINPIYARQGIATLLLERVIEDAKADGYEVVEAYPNKIFISPTADFMGPLSMYEKHGFYIQSMKDENSVVVRKNLK